jgi:hypothetical protein
MKRLVQPELLDSLPPDDPRARGSRRDLQRINWWMSHHGMLARTLRQRLPDQTPGRLLEIGAGDGEFFLRLARQFVPPWSPPRATLLDMQNIVTSETLAACARLGWQVDVMVADVFDDTASPEPTAAVFANLFLHHFADDALARLLLKMSQSTDLFIALEPRRVSQPWICGQLLRLIGCNAVTLHDGVVSVRAGFAGRELSALWPQLAHWQLTERRAGLFSHLFVAQRRQ